MFVYLDLCWTCLSFQGFQELFLDADNVSNLHNATGNEAVWGSIIFTFKCNVTAVNTWDLIVLSCLHYCLLLKFCFNFQMRPQFKKYKIWGKNVSVKMILLKQKLFRTFLAWELHKKIVTILRHCYLFFLKTETWTLRNNFSSYKTTSSIVYLYLYMTTTQGYIALYSHWIHVLFLKFNMHMFHVKFL